MKVFVASPARFKISISLRDKDGHVLSVKPGDIIDVSCLTGLILMHSCTFTLNIEEPQKGVSKQIILLVSIRMHFNNYTRSNWTTFTNNFDICK